MTKAATLLLKLENWCSVPDLCAEFGWKPHSLRAVLCGLDAKLERRRENGVTSYRVAQESLDDGQPSELQEWQDYDRDC